MHFLGQFYENGWETPVDRQAAFAWYQRSAEGGDFRGQCSHASVLAEQGRIEEALHWLRLAVTTATPAYLGHLAPLLKASCHNALRAFADTLPRYSPAAYRLSDEVGGTQARTLGGGG